MLTAPTALPRATRAAVARTRIIRLRRGNPARKPPGRMICAGRVGSTAVHRPRRRRWRPAGSTDPPALPDDPIRTGSTTCGCREAPRPRPGTGHTPPDGATSAPGRRLQEPRRRTRNEIPPAWRSWLPSRRPRRLQTRLSRLDGPGRLTRLHVDAEVVQALTRRLSMVQCGPQLRTAAMDPAAYGADLDVEHLADFLVASGLRCRTAPQRRGNPAAARPARRRRHDRDRRRPASPTASARRS